MIFVSSIECASFKTLAKKVLRKVIISFVTLVRILISLKFMKELVNY